MNRRDWAVISSDYLNSWGIVDAIRATGWQGRLVCLDRGEDPFTLMNLYRRGVEVWRVPLAANLLVELGAKIPKDDRKFLFFTEEWSLEQAAAGSANPWCGNATWYPSSHCTLDRFLDRGLFYEFIGCRGLGEVPFTVPGERDPFGVFGTLFFFRFRRTWLQGRRTPRIRLIGTRAEFQRAVENSERLGFSQADWCYQEALSLDPQDNISVCGWHDSNDPLYVATHKVLQFPTAQGNGDVCEVLPLPEELGGVTRRLLDELEFSGPFELEFILDRATGKYCVIELNPRFWMQHPLAGSNLGHALVRRYLGLPKREIGSGSETSYWVNSVVAVYRALRGDLRAWQYLRDPAAICVPPLSVTMRWLPRFAINLAARRFRTRWARQSSQEPAPTAESGIPLR